MAPRRLKDRIRAATRTTGYERRDSAAALWALRAAGFAFVLLAVAAAAHRYALLETIAFLWVLGLAGMLAVLALALSAAGFSAMIERGDRGGRRSLAALLVAFVVLSPFLSGLWRFAAYPRLADVSTDVDDPPRFSATPPLRDPRANRPAPIGRSEAALILEHYPEVNGRRYEAPAETVQEAIATLLAQRGWRLVAVSGGGPEDMETTLEAVAGSYILRFPVDVALRVTDEGTSTYVDMRSASHFGAHDLGDNAMRITRFLADLDAAVGARAP